MLARRSNRRFLRRALCLGVGLACLGGRPIGLAASDGPSDESSRSASAGQATPEQIPGEVFIASPFADFFQAGDYPRALDAIEALAGQYPRDPLIRRYRALALDRLGRYDEAIRLYDELLAQNPNHVPTRFFRAQSYEAKGERDKAIEELRWVADNSQSTEYATWARESLSRLGVRAARPATRKRLYLFGNEGWEYDSNVILKSNDPGLGVGPDKNASRLAMNVGLGYRAVQRSNLQLDAIYIARQSLHDDGLDEFNFTAQEAALDLKKRASVFDREVTFGSRYELAAGFLDGHTFSLSNELRLSSDARMTPQTRTYLYDRFAAVNYGPDGSNPPQTSRDGIENGVGVTQYFYSSDFRSHLFVNEEFEIANTRGANFTREGTSTRVGGQVPLPYVPRTDLDTSLGFRWAQYPRFESLTSLDPNQRLDNNWDWYVSLTHRIRPRLSTRVFYRYINANNRNDVFQYDRHIAGVQVLFTQYF